MFKKIIILSVFPIFYMYMVHAQRTYAPQSVLSTGNWFRISVDTSGIYKIDAELLNRLGVQGSTASVRLFGNGGGMLPEACNAPYTDDLQEVPLLEQGGVLFFYAPGPHRLLNDPANAGFTHRLNLYDSKSYYYITIGGTPKRINTTSSEPAPTRTTNQYDDFRFYENDIVNFLGSGKEWYGEEFANAPGKVLNRQFNFSFPGLVVAEPIRVTVAAVSRSLGGSSRFRLTVNGVAGPGVNVPATGSGPYDLFAREITESWQTAVNTANVQVGLTYEPGSFNAQGWLNWIRVHARGTLDFTGRGQWQFRDLRSVGAGGRTRFEIGGSPATAQVWEITDPAGPLKQEVIFSGNQLSFVRDAARLREYIAFDPVQAKVPRAIGKVPNQNLHGAVQARMLIVTDSLLLPEALRLAAWHQEKDQLTSLVVTPAQIYNEFSSGSPDPVAIRDFLKMYYDRAGGDTSKMLRYLLLFGDASYDYKNRLSINTNLVPAYQSSAALDPLTTFTSDDFFGFLDNHEDINSGLVTNLLDIGIGRIPATTREQAANMTDKIIAYQHPAALGAWRNGICFVADDEDANLHLNDAEFVSEGVETINPVFTVSKLYLDAFQQQSTSAGSRYPEVTQASNNTINSGTLIWNYSGHGGFTRLAEEVVLDKEIAAGWKNENRYPLLITATCDFAPYDNPGLASLGEQVLMQRKSGAIALMTTTRVVFAFSNRVMNYNYLQTALKPDAAGNYLTLGQAVRVAKNFTYQSSTDITNNRKFTLLGDPALALAFPRNKIKITAVNGKPVAALPDTLRALDKAIINGIITRHDGTVLSSFNGTLSVTVYDKKKLRKTRGNDPGSVPIEFESREQVLYKGKAEVKNGVFAIEFIVPKDINYQFGPGWLSLYAENGTTDAADYYNGIIVGGGSGNSSPDQEGPGLKAFLNDEKFVNGSITNSNPVLLVKLIDSSGINTSGVGIGHDITAILDRDLNNPIVLNTYYEADKDSYKKGTIRYQLPELQPGEHTLLIKAWDAANNSGTTELSFRVGETGSLSVENVLNYPNPFTTRTQFWFEHNRPFEPLQVHVRVFSLSGKLVKSLKNTINTTGNRSSELEWDGKDDFGARLARGVYWYILQIRTTSGQSKEIIRKLVIL